MATYHLHKWSVVSLYDDPYLAPEINPKCLSGCPDGQEKRIRSSPIKEIDGRKVTTSSGSVYILEDMDDSYKEWLDTEGHTYDPANPIVIRKKKP